MISSSAAWVLAGERLISSASSNCVNTGPGRKRNSWVFMSKIGAPVMSEGIRSAVNWMRPKRQPNTRPSVRHEQRLAQPGHALDQHVTAGEQGHQRAQHQFLLPHVDLADLGRDPVEQLLGGRFAGARQRRRPVPAPPRLWKPGQAVGAGRPSCLAGRLLPGHGLDGPLRRGALRVLSRPAEPSRPQRTGELVAPDGLLILRQPRLGKRHIRRALQQTAKGFHVFAEIGRPVRWQVARPPKNRKDRHAKDNSQRDQVQQNTANGPLCEGLQPRVHLLLLIGNRQTIRAALQKNHLLPRRATLLDQAPANCRCW